MCLKIALYFYIHVCVGEETQGDQKRASDTLELKLQAVLNHPMLVLGTELITPCEEQFVLSTPQSQALETLRMLDFQGLTLLFATVRI